MRASDARGPGRGEARGREDVVHLERSDPGAPQPVAAARGSQAGLLSRRYPNEVRGLLARRAPAAGGAGPSGRFSVIHIDGPMMAIIGLARNMLRKPTPARRPRPLTEGLASLQASPVRPAPPGSWAAPVPMEPSSEPSPRRASAKAGLTWRRASRCGSPARSEPDGARKRAGRRDARPEPGPSLLFKYPAHKTVLIRGWSLTVQLEYI